MSAPNQTTETIDVQGTSVPRLGFGTWQIEGSDATEAVRDALEIGYRQIDTARAYGNEAEVTGSSPVSPTFETLGFAGVSSLQAA